MGILSRIEGLFGDTDVEMAMHKVPQHGPGAIVYTHPLHDVSSSLKAYSNTTHGIEMNKNGAFSGTPVQMHNGIDDVLWTGTNEVGTSAVFNSGDQSFPDGLEQSVKITKAQVNDVIQFDKGSDQILSAHTAFTFKIYVESNWAVGDSITFCGFDTGTGLTVGVPICLEQYFNFADFGEWHTVVVPLVDLELESSTIDAVRFVPLAKSGQAPTWYIDDLQLEEAGGGIVFTARPTEGHRMFIHGLRLMIVDNILPAANPWDTFFGINKLANGVVYRRSQEGVGGFTFNTRCLQDMVFVGLSEKDVITDGTDTMFTYETRFSTPNILSDATDDFATITISDDLTDLLSFRAVIFGTQELIK